MHLRRSDTRAFPVLMMLTPLQLHSVYNNPSCDGCAREAEEIECEIRIWSTNRSQGKTERHLYLSIKQKNKKCKPPLIVNRMK